MSNADLTSSQCEPIGQPVAEVLESISDAFFALDGDWRFAYLNGVAERLLRRPRAWLLGRVVWDEFPEAAGSAFEAEYRRAVADRVTVRFEAYFGPLGNWFEVRAHPTPAGLSVYFQDATGRRHAEESLRRSERRYRSLVAATSSIVWTTDPEGAIADESPSWEEFTGQPPSAYRGWGWAEAVHPLDREATAAAWRRSPAVREPYQVDYRLLRRDGAYRTMVARGAPVVDADGVVREWVGTCSDVTEARHAERELRRNESLLRGMAESAPLGLYLVDERTGAILFFNRRFCEIWGIGHLEGRMRAGELGDSELIPEALARVADPSAFVESSERLRADPGRDDAVDEFPLLDGRAIRRFSSRIRDEHGRYFGRLFIDEDVTEQRRAEASLRQAKEEAERASGAKDEFIAVLSHELRTPLTPVLLTASMMEAHPGLPPELREDVASIRRNVELESQLIADLLDLTRIAKGKLELDLGVVDVHVSLRMAIEICQRAEAVRLVADLAAARHHVRGDPTRLQQVFWNLSNNAQKFTEPGGTITVRTADLDGGRLGVEVVDTGVGIDPAVLPRLFDAFEQGDARARRSFAGLGLGLAISRKLVAAHGGTIVARSEGKGRGATFAVELPAFEGVEDRPAGPGPRPPARGEPIDVLLVEDHVATQRILARLLRRLGHRVTATSSVASALAACNQGDFGLILSDLGLPDGSGLDLIRQVRARYGGRAIALTGYGMKSDIRASRDAGFAEHLTKPVNLDALQATIARVLGTLDPAPRREPAAPTPQPEPA